MKKLEENERLVVWWKYPTVVNEINKLLKPHGLKLKGRTCYKEWGDQVAMKVVQK